MAVGSCLCGAVAVTFEGALPAPVACHCTLCRIQSGHVWASVNLPLAHTSIAGEDHVAWFRATPDVRRGFCPICGTVLFFHPDGDDHIAVSAGLFANPTGMALKKHIFTADKGDYYAISEGEPQE